MQFLPAPFTALSRYHQFIVYRLSPSDRPGKTDKRPINPYKLTEVNGGDTSFWTDAPTAIEMANSLGSGFGTGFYLTKEDPFFFLDIDDCLSPDGQWSPDAIELCTLFKGAAIEVSSSNKGLHIIGSGVCPPHACNPSKHKFELYTEKRFIALTGTNAIGDANFDCSSILPSIVDRYFKPGSIILGDIEEWSSTPCENWNGPEDDEELVNRALISQSKAAYFDKSKASFRDLWDANVEILSNAYPPNVNSKNTHDASEADLALAQHLAFWTGNNHERMHRLMFKSQLFREKWNRADYLPRTIRIACNRQKQNGNFYNQKVIKTQTQQPINTNTPVQRHSFLSLAHQLDLFKGCVYVEDQHKILTPEDELINPAQFKARFSGGTFLLNMQNDKKTRDPYESFISHDDHQFDRVHTTCFNPKLAHREIVKLGKLKAINICEPHNAPRVKGDPSLFLTHVKKLYPREEDQLALLSYMAALVKDQGIKFQYAALIQGVSGNGKTLLVKCLTYAIGEKYTHSPNPMLLTEKFNEWQYEKIFIAVEDIDVSVQQMSQVIEQLKPMITLERPEIRYPGGFRRMKTVCSNYMFVLNNKSGIRKHHTDRRLMPLFSAQQDKRHLERDGLTSEYFMRLYNWLDNENGYAIVNEFLHTYQIKDQRFNPANKQPAPITSSTDEAIQHGFGEIEQEILEQVEQETPGFKGGWISSFAIDRLIKQLNLNREAPRCRRRELLQALGYDWHPALPQGRTITPISLDGGKPRIFIKNEHMDLNLSCPGRVVEAFLNAQK